GALIMGHGDDGGLRVPPRLAPVQVAVLLVRDEGGAREQATALAAELQAAGVRTELDDRVDTSFGRRAIEWELKGVPLRVELGPRDVGAGTATVVRRDKTEKETAPLDGLPVRLPGVLEEIQLELKQQAEEWLSSRTTDAASVE